MAPREGKRGLGTAGGMALLLGAGIAAQLSLPLLELGISSFGRMNTAHADAEPAGVDAIFLDDVTSALQAVSPWEPPAVRSLRVVSRGDHDEVALRADVDGDGYKDVITWTLSDGRLVRIVAPGSEDESAPAHSAVLAEDVCAFHVRLLDRDGELVAAGASVRAPHRVEVDVTLGSESAKALRSAVTLRG